MEMFANFLIGLGISLIVLSGSMGMIYGLDCALTAIGIESIADKFLISVLLVMVIGGAFLIGNEVGEDIKKKLKVVFKWKS